jgi:hypothetical protein
MDSCNYLTNHEENIKLFFDKIKYAKYLFYKYGICIISIHIVLYYLDFRINILKINSINITL